MTDPRSEYERRLGDRRTLVRALEKRDAWYANGRLAIFLAGVAFAWAIWGPFGWPLGLLAIPLGLFIYLVVFHEWIRQRLREAQLSVRYYEDGRARLADQWAGRGNPGADLRPEEHIYAEDLDIFGEGSLFELLCAARTRAGEETLSDWLLGHADRATILGRQEAIQGLTDEVDLRETLWIVGGEARAKLRPKMLVRWASAPRGLPGTVVHVIAIAVTAAVIGTTAAWTLGAVPGSLIALPVIVALVVQRSLRHRVAEVLHAGDEPLKDLQVLSGVARRIEGARLSGPRLQSLQAALNTEGKPASAAIRSLARLNAWQEAQRNAMFAPFALAVLWNVHFAYAMERWRARYGARVETWLATIGEFEALCSLATYAYENPEDVYPSIAEGAPAFAGESLGHPLLPRANCVRNSVTLSGQTRLLVVSGSNMSGKSTLLRTVGINAVLALAGAPVRARSLALSPLAIGASMHIIDSIQRGTSHFYAEILRLHSIMNAARGPNGVLFLVDEILHGTNSHDRRIGAQAVVRGLVDAGAIGLITTHDLALTKITDELSGAALNVHFVDRLEDGKLVFDYKMQPGVVERSNALALMRSVGLDV